VAKVVKYNGLMTLRQEKRGNGTPNIPGTAGNQSSHKISVLPERVGLPWVYYSRATRNFAPFERDRRQAASL